MLTTNGTSIAAGKRRYFQEEGGFKSGDLSILEWNKGYCVSVKTVLWSETTPLQGCKESLVSLLSIIATAYKQA